MTAPRSGLVVVQRARNGGHFEASRVLCHLARAQLAGGDSEAALRASDEAVDVARRQQVRVLECEALITRASVVRLTEHHSDDDLIVNDLLSALVLSEETGARSYEPFIHEELGRLRNDEAELREAHRLYQQVRATDHARRLEAELSARTIR